MMNDQQTCILMIRVIDFANFESNKESIADQVWAAVTEDGAFRARNFVPKDELDEAFKLGDELFHLPKDDKSQFNFNTNQQVRPNGSYDVREDFRYAPDQDAPPQYKAQLDHYFKVSLDLCLETLDIIAPRIGLEPDYFHKNDVRGPKNLSRLSVCHYAETAQENIDPKYVRIPSHRDPSLLTLMFDRKNSRMIQFCVDPLKGPWMDSDGDDDTILCMIGDLLPAFVANNEKLSARMHRLAGPLSPADRYDKIGFFYVPNNDLIIPGTSSTAEERLKQTIDKQRARYRSLLHSKTKTLGNEL